MVLVTVTVVHSSVVEVLVIDTFGRTLTVVVVVRVPVAHVDGSGVDIIVVLYGLRSQTRRGTTGFRSTAYHVNIHNFRGNKLSKQAFGIALTISVRKISGL